MMNNRKPSARLVMLGVGQVALQVAEIAGQYQLLGTTRNPSKSAMLNAVHIEPFVIEPDFSTNQQEDLIDYISGSKVLVSFPPDVQSDVALSSFCAQSDTIIYLSSTTVYGNYNGIVDESTAVDWQSQKSKMRLQAEKAWLKQGAIVLRAPGLYGPKSGLHIRLRDGSYKLPPENTNYISRIHLKDLARIILAAFAKPLPSHSIYLVGDSLPAPQIEVVQWLCQKMNLPRPAQCAPNEVPETLTANRRVNPSKILKELNLKLEFPSYREGYADCLGLTV